MVDEKSFRENSFLIIQFEEKLAIYLQKTRLLFLK